MMTEEVKVMRFGRVEGRVVALRRLTVGERGKLGLSYVAIADRPYVATVELDCPVLGKSTVEKLVAARCADDEIRLLKDGSAVLEVVVAREEGPAHGA